MRAALHFDVRVFFELFARRMHELLALVLQVDDHVVRLVLGRGRYVPHFGGWGAWGMVEGQDMDIDPTSFLIQDGHFHPRGLDIMAVLI